MGVRTKGKKGDIMGKTIPYFYGDLIARMVPGTILVALIKITALPTPQPWTDFMRSLGNAHAVIVPILLAGLVYVLGTVLEALLSSILERYFVFAFTKASSKYTPLYPIPDYIKDLDVKKAVDLSRASFGHLIASPSDSEKQAIPHLVRFHAEAKMCFSSAIVLVAFLVLATALKLTNHQWLLNIEKASLWLSIMVLAVPVLAYTAYQRLQSRALYVFRSIERSVAEKEVEATKKLRDDLLALCRKNNKRIL